MRYMRYICMCVLVKYGNETFKTIQYSLKTPYRTSFFLHVRYSFLDEDEGGECWTAVDKWSLVYNI